MPTEFVEAFTGDRSRELLEFTLCACVFAAGVSAWITWYMFKGD